MPVINQVVAETRLTMAITSARVTRLTRGLGADRWPRHRPLARNSRVNCPFPQRASPLTCSRAPAAVTAFSGRGLAHMRHRVCLEMPQEHPTARAAAPAGAQEQPRAHSLRIPENRRQRPAAHDDRDQVRVLLRGPAALAAAHPAGSSPMEVDAQLLPRRRAVLLQKERERMAVSSDTGSCVLSCRRRRSSWRCFGRSCSWWDVWNGKKTNCLTARPALPC